MTPEDWEKLEGQKGGYRKCSKIQWKYSKRHRNYFLTHLKEEQDWTDTADISPISKYEIKIALNNKAPVAEGVISEMIKNPDV